MHLTKKIISVALLIFVISLSMDVHATETISEQEYYSAIQDLFSQYGITDIKMTVPKHTILTEPILEQELQTLKKQLNSFSNVDYVLISENNSDESFFPSTRALMPYSKTYTFNKSVSNDLGIANIKVVVKATKDAQYNKLMSINSVTSSRSGAGINFRGWKHKSYSSSYSIPQVSVKGTLSTGYTMPVTNIDFSTTSNHTIAIYFIP